MGMSLEYLIDFRHIASTAGEDDTTHQLIREFYRYLEPGIFYDFLHTSLNNLDKLLALYGSVLVNRVVECWVDIADIGVGLCIFQLHLFCISILELEASQVLGDVVSTQWDDREMAQDTLVVNGYGSGVGTQVNEHTSGSLLRVGQYAVCHSQWCEIHLRNRDICILEAGIDIVIEVLAPKDIQEDTFQMAALYAYRVNLVLVVYLVFLCCSVKNFLVWISHVAVDVHQLINHILRDDRCAWQIFHDDVLEASDRSASYTHVNLGNILFEEVLQLLDDASEALACFVDVIDNTLSDTRRRVFLDGSQHGDAAV